MCMRNGGDSKSFDVFRMHVMEHTHTGVMNQGAINLDQKLYIPDGLMKKPIHKMKPCSKRQLIFCFNLIIYCERYIVDRMLTCFFSFLVL